ncbi:MAG: S-layer homology domain-containing protein [bacterium]
MFASVAIVAMLSTAVPTTVLGAASYSDELQGAYDYALTNGITTQSSIDTANMYGSLIRSHMAKMMVNYAVEVKGLTPDTTKTCEFTDVANQTDELQGYITKACQLGLMGVGITAFNPNGVVTRAQFGTVLDRVLNGATNDGSDPYYTAHLNALKDAGVMNNISNPNAPEVRGYVMLMMKRADEGTSPAVCETPENTLSCSLGLDTCPAECTVTPEVKAGSLNVSLNSDSLANATQIPMAGTVKFAVVNFKAGSEDVSLKSVEVKKVGLASFPSSSRVWFEKDGIRISGKAAFTSDGSAIVSFAPTYVVKGGSTASLDLYVELSTTAGQDLQLASANVDSTAQDVNGSFTTPVLRTASYTVAPVTVSAASADAQYNVTADAIEVGAFKLQNLDTSSEIRDVKFQSITLRQAGNASLSNLSDIVLVRNGVTISKNYSINGKDITFSVNDIVKDGTTATYYIKAVVTTVEYAAGDIYNFGLRYTTDLNAVEASSSFRSTVTGTPTLYSYTVKGGDITFAKDSSVELSTNYAAGSDVTLMQGTISAKNAITLEDVTLTGANGLTEAQMAAAFSTIYLKVGGSTFSYSPAADVITPATWTSTGVLVTATGHSASYTNTSIKFFGSATVNSTASVKLYGKLRDTAPAGILKFNDMNLASFTTKEYVSNQNAVTSYVGSIAGITVTVQGSALNITKSDALGDQSIAQGANGLLVYGVKLSSTQGGTIAVSNAVFDVTGTASFANNAYLTLFVNGKAVGTKTVTSSTVSFDTFNVNVDKNTPATLEIKANITDSVVSGTIKVSLKTLNAVDTLTSNSISGITPPAGAIFTIAAADAVVASSDNNPQPQLLLSPSMAQKLLAFKVTAKNDDVKLYDVNLTGTALNGLSNFAIVDASGNVIATATTNTNTNVAFTQIANAPKVLKDKSITYYVIADVNSNTNTAAISLTLATAGIDLKATNGSVVNPAAFTTIASRTHAINENTLVIAKAANTSKLLTTSALRFTATAAGKNSVTLNSVSLTNLLAGYTGTANVVIYKDSVSTANIAGSGASSTITLNANNTVDAGNTVTYIVAVEGVVVDSSKYSQDWSVALTNVLFNTSLNANLFNNVASFPITEVK